MAPTQPSGRDRGNRRTFGRMVMRLAPALVVHGEEGMRTAERVRLVDLSTTGAQVLAPHPPSVGATVWLRLTESRRNIELTLQAEVMWTAPLGERWRAGLRFEALPRETTSLLARWLFSLQRQAQTRQHAA